MLIHKTSCMCTQYSLSFSCKCMHLKNSGGECVVLLYNDIVIVADPKITMESGEPFVKLVKVAKTPEDAYARWRHVIGKLSCKDSSSKYFGSPKEDEHMTNGNCPSFLISTVIDVTKQALIELEGSL